MTRKPLPQIAYSIDAIKQIIKSDRKPRIEKIYDKLTIKDITAARYSLIIVEDSKSGFQFFSKAAGGLKTKCESANGKSNILSVLEESSEERVLVIADAATLGAEIQRLSRYKAISRKKIDFFLPESF